MAHARDFLTGLEDCLRAHAGFDLPRWIVESRARGRMAALGLSGPSYLALVRSARGMAELDQLTESLRVGETRFFRHMAQLDAITETVVPAWLAGRVRRPRVWSVGCASGEEPYTLAMMLSRALPGRDARPDIVATDVSCEALDVARAGRYPASVLAHIPELYRSAVVVESGSLRIQPEVARLVRFEHGNLNAGDQPYGFDLVFCRNVLIYFDAAARQRALAKLVAALNGGGFLFLGYSETLRDVPGLVQAPAGDPAVWVKGSAKTPGAPQRPIATPAQPAAERATETAPARAGRSAARAAAAVVLHVHRGDPSRLTADVARALRTPGVVELTIDLDSADYLTDEVAPVLKRATTTALAAGVALTLKATRVGARRFVQRNGLTERAP